MRRAVVAIAVLLLLGGALWLWASGLGGEQMFGYGVRNDSSRPVVVRFGSYGAFLVPPGRDGRGAYSFGRLHGDIEILDQQCRLLESVPVTTQSGSLWIREGAPARLSEIPWRDLPTHLLEVSPGCRE